MDISREFSGIRLKNPLILASGVVGNSLQKMIDAYRAGASCVVTKSTSIKPRKGYPKPTFYFDGVIAINAVGLSNPGAEKMQRILKNMENVPFIASVFGKNEEEYVAAVKVLDRAGPIGFELNLSCPHVKGYGTEIGHDTQLVSLIVEQVKEATRKPVFVKLSPNTEKIIAIAKSAEDAGADGVVAINTVKAMMIDAETGRAVVSNRIGGLSGEAIRPIALRCVYELYEELNIPIIGVGGISKWEHVVQFAMAGATAVEIGTAAYYKIDVFREILSGIKEYMWKKSLASFEELVGLSHRI